MNGARGADCSKGASVGKVKVFSTVQSDDCRVPLEGAPLITEVENRNTYSVSVLLDMQCSPWMRFESSGTDASTEVLPMRFGVSRQGRGPSHRRLIDDRVSLVVGESDGSEGWIRVRAAVAPQGTGTTDVPNVEDAEIGSLEVVLDVQPAES